MNKEELRQYSAKLMAENERLNQYIDFYKDLTERQNKDLEGLNNIINELEKWLEEKQILYGINQQGFSWGVCGEALDKLQELKGEDK